MGKNSFFRNKSENQSLKFLEDLFMQFMNIKKGEKFTKENIRVIRPGFGIQPVYFEKLLNKKSPFTIMAEITL